MDSACSRFGLNGLNFFLAAIQTGFGPFVAVWLTRQHWDETDIGLALSIGTGVALLAQLPAGILVDSWTHTRAIATTALLMLAGAAAIFAMPATLPSIWTAEIMHAVASAVMIPVIAAMTLASCGHAAFSQRLGMNARYASIGNAAAGGMLGVVAYYSNEAMVFWTSALLVLPALAMVYLLRMGARRQPPAPPERLAEADATDARPWRIFREPALHAFALCALLFHLANAAMLPLALNGLALRTTETDFAVSASIVLPQAIMAIFAPWAGALAQRIGRRPVLLVGFAALPLRALLFSTAPDATFLVLYQALDGVSATVFGLMMPLIAADLTRRTGYLNLAIGSIGLAAGLGATFSTAVAGLVSDYAGPECAFFGLAGAGVAALVLVFVAMPETRPGDARGTAVPLVAA
jgi:predicted MFS family arabinose efflux permease